MGGNGFPGRIEAGRIAMVELQLRGRGIRDERVLEAMTKVPRHEFVAPAFADKAYDDQPLPIGEGQTVSQPYIVAAMLESLSLKPSDKVLEIGTGSGYQTALLAELVAEVFSIERHASLSQAAQQVLERLDYQNVHVRTGDGSLGWPEAAPFEGIIISAAAPQLPPSLIAQLNEGGRMIAPVGTPEVQELRLIRRLGDEIRSLRLDGCRFVPLVGKEGFTAL
jgi:protein-L-isoaspartate(D-aspartate) O-methyltransferase